MTGKPELPSMRLHRGICGGVPYQEKFFFSSGFSEFYVCSVFRLQDLDFIALIRPEKVC